MALEGRVDIRETLPAAADLSAQQYRFVAIDGSGDLAVPSAADRAFVLVDKPDEAGKSGTFIVVGKTKVEAGEAIAIGDNVGTDGSGLARTAITGDEINGIALSSASAAGELVTILVTTTGTAA